MNVSDSTLTLAAKSAGSATITVTAADRSSGHADRLKAAQDFTVTVDETNAEPTFNEGPRTTRSVAENTSSGIDVGSPVSATDEDDDTLTYSLSGTDAGSFRIGRISGQIRTFDSLNFETKNSYSVIVTTDDDNGGTDSIDVTINIIDVNEAPVGKPIADRTLAHGVLSREIDLSRYFSDPDTNDTLIYTAETPDTDVATVSVVDSMLTLERVSGGSATITVTAADRSLGDADRLTASQNFTVTVEAPLPTVTIARHRTTPVTVTKGGLVRFTLTASSAPTADLTVSVTVTETDPHLAGRITDFITGTIPDEITITAGTTTGDLILDTEDDTVDETDTGTLARVENGTGYMVGSPSVAVVTIEDNDVPPAPTGLRANGDLDSNGNVMLRWNPVSGATSYNLRHVEEICSSSRVCEPDGGVANPNWEPPVNIAPSTGAVMEVALGGLTEKKLYRVQVQAVIADTSRWSDFTLVYPTTNAPNVKGTRIATIELNTFQANGRFDYKICNPAQAPASETDPSQLPPGITVQDVQDALREWDGASRWRDTAGNVIQTNGSSITTCDDPEDPNRSRNQVMFYNDNFIDRVCNSKRALGCWAWPNGDLVTPIGAQSILLKDSIRGSVTGCSRVYRTLVHEGGHALGLSHGTIRDSIVSTLDIRPPGLCEPTAYDAVAIMTNYQSR